MIRDDLQIYDIIKLLFNYIIYVCNENFYELATFYKKKTLENYYIWHYNMFIKLN